MKISEVSQPFGYLSTPFSYILYELYSLLVFLSFLNYLPFEEKTKLKAPVPRMFSCKFCFNWAFDFEEDKYAQKF